MALDFSMLPDLHDVQIFGIEHSLSQKVLFLQLVFPDSRKSVLSFPGVFGWRLTSFDEQNIIYRTDIYKGRRLLDDIESDEPIHAGHLQWAIEEQGVIFNIDSVTGIRGYIVSKELNFVS